jgi:predicted GNAT family acetyltransferase
MTERMRDDSITVEDNEAAQRYEVRLGDARALLQYERKGDRIVFLHTEVPAALEGRGIGSALARGALDDARARGLSVVPLCPFVRAYIQRHPEYLPLVDSEHRARLA